MERRGKWIYVYAVMNVRAHVPRRERFFSYDDEKSNDISLRSFPTIGLQFLRHILLVGLLSECTTDFGVPYSAFPTVSYDYLGKFNR